MPTSTNALVELMNMVERWRQRTDYGPVVVVSQDGIGRWNIIEYWNIFWLSSLFRAGVYCAANACIEQVIQHGEVRPRHLCRFFSNSFIPGRCVPSSEDCQKTPTSASSKLGEKIFYYFTIHWSTCEPSMQTAEIN